MSKKAHRPMRALILAGILSLAAASAAQAGGHSTSGDFHSGAGAATKAWVLPVTTPLCTINIDNGGRITADNGDKATFGGVDFLVNVACNYVDGGIGASRRDWLDSYNINVVGGVMMLKSVRPHMVRRGGGAVVNFGSISAKVAQRGRWLYPVSKAAILQVTRNEAMDLAGDNIRVNSVSPGWTWSKVIAELTRNNRAKADSVGAPFHLLGRIGNPEEVAQAVLFLCSADSSFITGTDVAVDGGYTAMGPERTEEAIPKLAE